MKLVSVTIENFRCYQNQIKINFDELTTIIGKNDIGKSSILEALEIFFNNDLVTIDSRDSCVFSDSVSVNITCEFSELPIEIVLDAGAVTSLAQEYLLSKDGTLLIRKSFDCSKKTPSCEVFILAYHPTASGLNNLLELKEKDLQQLVRAKGLSVSLKGNPGMRKALWGACEDLRCAEVALPVTKSKEDSKRIWEQLEGYLPMFALFQSDRSSKDSDSEVQDPMKAAVATAISEVQDEIIAIQEKVKQKAEQIANNTLDALKSIDANLAKELNPQFAPPTPSKWQGLFSVGMETDNGIPLNKRGSGVRRLILVSFFKAEAKRRLTSSDRRSIIYAIEEPETAQHPNNQKILIESFKSLSSEQGCQVLLTTHSPGFAADLPVDGMRFIRRDNAGTPCIEAGVDVFGEVADTLGLAPDSRVKILFCVEGPTDVAAFKCLSRAFHLAGLGTPDLHVDDRIAFVVLGGSTLKHWVAQHYLRALNKPEVHIYDRDVKSYGDAVAAVNSRGDQSWAVQTNKHEIESYLHSDAIHEAFNVVIEITDHPNIHGKAVPKVFAEAYSLANKLDGTMGDDKAKIRLAEKAFPLMNLARIRERDPDGEVEGWFRRLLAML